MRVIYPEKILSKEERYILEKGSSGIRPHNMMFTYIILHIHPRKLTCPLKRDYFSRQCIFQPLNMLVFRGVNWRMFVHPGFLKNPTTSSTEEPIFSTILWFESRKQRRNTHQFSNTIQGGSEYIIIHVAILKCLSII